MKDKMKDGYAVGQTVVYYEPYHRNIVDTAAQGTITKVGTRYIHVGRLKFDRETMYSDIPHCGLFAGTLGEFREAVGLQKEILSLLDRLKGEVSIHTPLPGLRAMKDKLTDLYGPGGES